MTFAYGDLGEQTAGSTAVVRWRGSAANVGLLDRVNFAKYREGQTPVFYSAGGHGRSPVRLPIPGDGRWFVVADFIGLDTKGTVEIVREDSGKASVTEEKPLVEVR